VKGGCPGLFALSAEGSGRERGSDPPPATNGSGGGGGPGGPPVLARPESVMCIAGAAVVRLREIVGTHDAKTAYARSSKGGNASAHLGSAVGPSGQ
jgi:hypothetical protein